MDKTVMLVSGNRTLVMFLGILVKRMGFELVHASSGPAALGILGAVQADAVIIDGDIGDFGGLDTLERMREGGPAVPPVIMLVGAASEESERRCLAAGAGTVVTKPVSTEDLHHALEECIYLGNGFRRRYVRVRADIKVMVYNDGQQLNLLTESVSAGGLFVRHDTPLQVGTLVDIFLPLGDEECMFLAGRVIYNQKPCNNQLGLCPGFAVKFVNPAQREVDAIREFVSMYMTDDIIGLGDGAADVPDLPGLTRADVYSAMQSYLHGPEARRKSVA